MNIAQNRILYCTSTQAGYYVARACECNIFVCELQYSSFYCIELELTRGQFYLSVTWFKTIEHVIDTSAGGLIVLGCVIYPVVSISTLTWFIIVIYSSQIM